MSFLRITTTHPSGRQDVSVHEQPGVTAEAACKGRLDRARTAHREAHRDGLTIALPPTPGAVAYSQILEYADTLDGLDTQPTLPAEYLELMEKK